MLKIDKSLSALGNFVRTLDEYRVGAILLIIMMILIMLMIFVWKK